MERSPRTPRRRRSAVWGAPRDRHGWTIGAKGTASNPVQRRLSGTESHELVHRYVAGESINGLARELGVHRTTVISHLDRAGVTRRRTARKMTDESVARAAARYQAGSPLAVVAEVFGVHVRTLTKGLRRAGTEIRRRPGRAC